MVTTTFANYTIVIGGPCLVCGHDQRLHGPICDSLECPDLTPMCWKCVDAPWAVDAESARPAFHAYVLTPLIVAI